MKGLLYKDFSTVLNSYKKNFLLVTGLYTAMALAMDTPFMLYAMVVMFGLYTLSTLSFDDYSHWDMYARTLPLSNGQIVAAKYVLGLLFMGTGTAMVLILLAIIDCVKGRAGLEAAGQNFVGCLSVLAVVLVYYAIAYPLSYKYGDANKARSMVLLVMAVLGFCAFQLFRLTGSFRDAVTACLASATEGQVIGVLLLVFLAALAAYLVSWRISAVIYKAKEF